MRHSLIFHSFLFSSITQNECITLISGDDDSIDRLRVSFYLSLEIDHHIDGYDRATHTTITVVLSDRQGVLPPVIISQLTLGLNTLRIITSCESSSQLSIPHCSVELILFTCTSHQPSATSPSLLLSAYTFTFSHCGLYLRLIQILLSILRVIQLKSVFKDHPQIILLPFQNFGHVSARASYNIEVIMNDYTVAPWISPSERDALAKAYFGCHKTGFRHEIISDHLRRRAKMHDAIHRKWMKLVWF